VDVVTPNDDEIARVLSAAEWHIGARIQELRDRRAPSKEVGEAAKALNDLRGIAKAPFPTPTPDEASMREKIARMIARAMDEDLNPLYVADDLIALFPTPNPDLIALMGEARAEADHLESNEMLHEADLIRRLVSAVEGVSEGFGSYSASLPAAPGGATEGVTDTDREWDAGPDGTVFAVAGHACSTGPDLSALKALSDASPGHTDPEGVAESLGQHPLPPDREVMAAALWDTIEQGSNLSFEAFSAVFPSTAQQYRAAVDVVLALASPPREGAES
jgi:hypothetical protein